jgi:uncharacterized OB-fold protein
MMTTETVRSELGDWVHRPLLPFVDPNMDAFWEGLKAHEFRVCRCTLCGRWWFPFTVCPEHDEIPTFADMEWAGASGRGTVFAKVVVHQVVDPAFTDEVPYVLAILALEEGPFFPARLVDCDPYEIAIGAPVEVVYLDSAEGGHTLPFFRPVP